MREDFVRDMHAMMPLKTEPFTQREGTWEELIRDVAAFAGKRVRVTILPDRLPSDAALNQGVRQWLGEGDGLEVTPQKIALDAVAELLLERARKQGLLI